MDVHCCPLDEPMQSRGEMSRAAFAHEQHRTHRKQGSRDGLSVLAAGHALHEDVADVPQDGACGQQHQRCKHKGADGVRKGPSRVVLQSSAARSHLVHLRH